MRRAVKGEEHLVLREDGYGGYESIEVKRLTAKMADVFSETTLTDLAKLAPMDLAALKAMTFIAFIKIDAAGKDLMGWRQHLKVLRDEGFDV